jgi:hypothetical protein
LFVTSQAAEKKKTPGFFRSTSKSLSSSISPSVRVGKLRRPVDAGGGGDSEDSVKRQKRLSSLEVNRNQAKQPSGMYK